MRNKFFIFDWRSATLRRMPIFSVQNSNRTSESNYQYVQNMSELIKEEAKRSLAHLCMCYYYISLHFRFLTFSRKLQSCARKIHRSRLYITYAIYLNSRNGFYTVRYKKNINFIDRLCHRSCDISLAVTQQFFPHSLFILYAVDFNYLIQWVIVTYIVKY